MRIWLTRYEKTLWERSVQQCALRGKTQGMKDAPQMLRRSDGNIAKFPHRDMWKNAGVHKGDIHPSILITKGRYFLFGTSAPGEEYFYHPKSTIGHKKIYADNRFFRQCSWIDVSEKWKCQKTITISSFDWNREYLITRGML